VDKLSEIAGQIQRGGTGVGEDIPSIFVWYTQPLVTSIPILESIHIGRHRFSGHGVGCNVLETILVAVPLAALGKTAMPVSHQLMGTCPGNSFNFEGEVDVLKY
jgi:hypothetical protein